MSQNHSEALDKPTCKCRPFNELAVYTGDCPTHGFSATYTTQNIEQLLKDSSLALLNRIEAGLPKEKPVDVDEENDEVFNENVGWNLALAEVQQLIKQEREKLDEG